MSKRTPAPSHYEVLGVATGASIDHVKDSYRLLTKKSPATDAAYRVLTNPELRRDYDTKLRESRSTQRPSGQEEEYYVVVCDKAGWRIVEDEDVGWELQALLPDRKVRLNAPKPVFGPFSKTDAAEFVSKRINGGAPETKSYWAEFGAREMPQKPPLPTHTELHYIAGIERMIDSGASPNVLKAVFEYTPEQLLQISGIIIETQNDLTLFVTYVQWLSDVGAWYKSLSEDVAAMVGEKLEIVREGRYRFLVQHLRAGGSV